MTNASTEHDPLPLIQAHRGASKDCPENSLAAFREAARQGARWIEFDVRLSADEIPVTCHDASLERTGNNPVIIREHPATAIVGQDIGHVFDHSFRNEPLPSLQETIRLFAELGLQGNIEIKSISSPAEEELSAIAVCECIRTHWPDDKPLPLISSFHWGCLKKISDIMPELRLGYLVEELPDDWKEKAAAINSYAIHPWHEPLTADQVRSIREEGYKVAVYTVNDTARAHALLDMGVDSIITDVPAVMLESLSSRT
ncbi:glycerophosphodiester phosphodiesterase family protein [Kiloniella sp. b19]|uniref:glycerophosphodiester phosphodiesterase family protein n=1 Tax=Kiloniella sp. GXU_MW_B19 TaxID=3141326 RepID=UPI0031D6C80A